MTQNPDIDVTAAEQERPSVSGDSLQVLYTDDIESQPLLPESSLAVEGKQTTGIVINNWSLQTPRIDRDTKVGLYHLPNVWSSRAWSYDFESKRIDGFDRAHALEWRIWNGIVCSCWYV